MNSLRELVLYHMSAHAIELLVDKKHKIMDDFDAGLISSMEYFCLLEEIESDISTLSGPLPD